MSRAWWCALAVVFAACSEDPAGLEADEFVIPLMKQSLDGSVTATLVAADPSPPARGANTWLVDISDAEGNPIEGLDLRVRPFMPQHGHGTSPTQVRATEVPGEYEVDRINFIMGGVWELRVYDETFAVDQEVRFYVNVPD